MHFWQDDRSRSRANCGNRGWNGHRTKIKKTQKKQQQQPKNSGEKNNPANVVNSIYSLCTLEDPDRFEALLVFFCFFFPDEKQKHFNTESHIQKISMRLKQR